VDSKAIDDMRKGAEGLKEATPPPSAKKK